MEIQLKLVNKISVSFISGVYVTLVLLVVLLETHGAEDLLIKYSTIGEINGVECFYGDGAVIHWAVNDRYIPSQKCDVCTAWSEQKEDTSKLYVTPYDEHDFGTYECRVSKDGASKTIAKFQLQERKNLSKHWAWC